MQCYNTYYMIDFTKLYSYLYSPKNGYYPIQKQPSCKKVWPSKVESFLNEYMISNVELFIIFH